MTTPGISIYRTFKADELLSVLANPELVAKAKEIGWRIEELREAVMIEPEITLDTRFDETGHAEQWRNKLAKDLNQLLRVSRWLNSQHDDWKNALLIDSAVARVAHFEEIQVNHEL